MAGSQVSLSGVKGTTGAAGATGATGAGAQALWLPGDSGLVAWNHDPLFASTSFVVTAGKLYLVLAKMAGDSAITQLHLAPRSPAGVALANTYMGVYTMSGGTATLAGQTADISTSVQTAGSINNNLTAATSTLTAGTKVLIGFLCGSGTTLPTLRSITQGNPNHNLTSASPYRTGEFGTGQTSLPASITLTSITAAGQFPWMGAS